MLHALYTCYNAGRYNEVMYLPRYWRINSPLLYHQAGVGVRHHSHRLPSRACVRL